MSPRSNALNKQLLNQTRTRLRERPSAGIIVGVVDISFNEAEQLHVAITSSAIKRIDVRHGVLSGNASRVGWSTAFIADPITGASSGGVPGIGNHNFCYRISSSVSSRRSQKAAHIASSCAIER
jgi:hypothetical protein